VHPIGAPQRGQDALLQRVIIAGVIVSRTHIITTVARR